MSSDDADPDDAGLDGLRSMWRSMPDDEPPARGLAELMAAARVKADEMAQPTLWERITAMLRRPQVLVLATILFLVGGAVFISQRREQLDAPAEAQQSAPAATGSAAMAGDPPLEDDLEPKGGERAREEAAPQTIAAPAESRDGNAMPRTGTTSRPIVAPSGTSAPAKKSASPTKSVTQPRKSAPASPMPDPDTAVGGAGQGPGASLAESEEATAKADDTAPQTATQLHTEALAAAAKNDCARVRVLAKQIARQDAPYYRANIAPDTKLASCLH